MSGAGPPDGGMGWTVEVVTWHRTKPEAVITLFLEGKTFEEAERVIEAEVAARIGARGVKVVQATATARVEGAVEGAAVPGAPRDAAGRARAFSVAAKIKVTRSRR